jgi:hypothetical protein
MMDFFQEIFSRFGGRFGTLPGEEISDGPCSGALTQAVEHVVDEISGRLRGVAKYARVLRKPVAASFGYIDEIVESIPGAFLCSRASFVKDPRVNAFFVSPQHLQEIFSRSEDVRQLFDAEPTAEECWALLCMRKEERHKLGMALVGDWVQKDVLQTAVSFTDHQIISPGGNETDAKRALKCCIFKGLLAHVRQRITAAKRQGDNLENRHRMLQRRLHHLDQRPEAEKLRTALLMHIEAVEREFGAQDLRLATIEDQLNLVADTLANPANFLTTTTCSLRLSRMGIKIGEGCAEPGYDLNLFEIRVASQEPRISALVRFPRDELLAQEEFLKKAELFLAM